jgi:hypothetical protein
MKDSTKKALRRIGERAHDTIPIPWATLIEDVIRQYESILNRA